MYVDVFSPLFCNYCDYVITVIFATILLMMAMTDILLVPLLLDCVRVYMYMYMYTSSCTTCMVPNLLKQDNNSAVEPIPGPVSGLG